ncbi:pre-mRNA-splicing factor CWC25 homolog [Vigna umbellata]|uniref:pre-mRNA-splicing factor CWC25 homolog n=1 Tax=Vigna umbellata TaxID=87088 RepID=UPI001F5F63CB|nr:pre-mRNA-splicing factor CWC25 homolog [Vigna umbellata]
MALKFLNKKGWHTGSLRNIENVWKAEQKHEAEQKKLEELRKQIQEERERTEFRLLQEKAGLVPHQERLEFLYDSGLSVGKSSNSEGFKALEQLPKSDGTDAPSSSASKEGASVPGALFEEKPQSANDAWRKLHSDPLLMIRQREQEALAKIKNNPVKMAMIKKSIEGTDHKEKAHKKEKRKKHRSSKSKHKKHSDSEDDPTEGRKRRTDNEDIDNKHNKAQSDSGYESGERENRRKDRYEDKKYRERSPSHQQRQRKGKDYEEGADDRNHGRSKSERSVYDAQSNPGYESDGGKRRRNHYEDRKYRERSPGHQQRQRNGKDYKEDGGDGNYNRSMSERYASEDKSNIDAPKSGGERFSSHERGYKRRNVAPKLSEEERAEKLRQMQLAAEVHEEQRWKRIKKAEESDAREVVQSNNAGGKNFLDSTQKSVYGAGEGGSASIAESVRRRTYYSQGRSGGEGNAFRR